MWDEIIAVPAFADNYIWLLGKQAHYIAVDPGDATPVRAFLEARQGRLAAILLTHHHPDHVGGVAELLAWQPVPVYGPASEQIDGVDHPLVHGDTLSIDVLDLAFEVIDVGGHTLGHIAYHTDGAVFSGDTLFAGGCGRIFEGSAEQMWTSLQRLAALPPATKIYCAHEYTEANLRFAMAVEPGNADIKRRFAEVQALRAKALPTVPSTLDLELLTNPFLRLGQPAVIAAAQDLHAGPLQGPVEVFAALREWKNVF